MKESKESNEYKILADKESKGTRIDLVLSLKLPEISRSFVQKLLEGGAVKVNGSQCVSKKYKVEEGDVIEAGQRVGIIRFGSRVDVYLPKNVSPVVEEGQTTVAGETVIAKFDEK